MFVSKIKIQGYVLVSRASSPETSIFSLVMKQPTHISDTSGKSLESSEIRVVDTPFPPRFRLKFITSFTTQLPDHFQKFSSGRNMPTIRCQPTWIINGVPVVENPKFTSVCLVVIIVTPGRSTLRRCPVPLLFGSSFGNRVSISEMRDIKVLGRPFGHADANMGGICFTN